MSCVTHIKMYIYFLFYFQHLFDRRDINDADGMYNAVCEHIDYSYHNGAIRPTITIFRKRQEGRSDLRVWNSLMLGFAGYSIESTKDGQFPGDENEVKKIGDQNNLAFTRVRIFNLHLE